MFHAKYLSVSDLITTCAVSVFIMMSVTDGSPVSSEFIRMRKQLISEDSQRRIGGQLILSADEQIVNKMFMKEKITLIENSRLNRTKYVPALSFFFSKPLIENSTLLKLIKRMPKGAALHLHDTSATNINWLVKNATYRDNVFMCVSKDGLINFSVFLNPPLHPDCVWLSVKNERAKAPDVDEFDQTLKRTLSMLGTDPLTSYSDNAQVWRRFVRYFSQVQNLVYYRPIFRDYFWRMLEEFRADNVQYIELRSSLKGVFDLDGTVHDAEFAVQIYKNTTEEFVQAFPDFSGAKIIMSGIRNSKFENILNEVKNATYLNKKYPDVMVGYDLVGNEAFFNPLIYYIDALLYPLRLDPPHKLPYFFHVGETNWQGTPTDNNLVEAILLNVTRIGHGYALPKRPRLLEIVKERNIPVEVNPLSNQMLRLVSDLRNHPMATLIADGFPIVISSDDVAVWEALPLSHDIYMAFTDLSGQDADLTFLKQLAINSIIYSSMNASEKDVALKLWQAKWDNFIQQMIQENTADLIPSCGNKDHLPSSGDTDHIPSSGNKDHLPSSGDTDHIPSGGDKVCVQLSLLLVFTFCRSYLYNL